MRYDGGGVKPREEDLAADPWGEEDLAADPWGVEDLAAEPGPRAAGEDLTDDPGGTQPVT